MSVEEAQGTEHRAQVKSREHGAGGRGHGAETLNRGAAELDEVKH